MTKVLAACVAVSLSAWQLLAGPTLAVPNQPDSLKFAVLGDNGSGDAGQYGLAEQMAAVHRAFPFSFVVMVGDNFYGSQSPSSMVKKFDQPYRPLLEAGVTFHAALGNHDERHVVDYPPLNMAGERYYTYVRQGVRFVVLDTNILDREQLRWFEATLQEARELWKIVYFHHPIYGNAARHGAAVDLRVLLEPLLIRYGVHIVFSGHDHIYERLTPQRGIHYFVTGSGGKLRTGDLTITSTTAAGFDREQVFLIAEVQGDQLFFQAISRSGATVDSGVIVRAARLTRAM